MSAPARPARSFRGLVGLLAAQAAAWTGTRFSALALPWFVLTTTGSEVQTGAVVFAQMGPYVVVQALAGPLLDRVGPRRVSIAGDLVAAGAMATVPLLYFLGTLPLWALMARQRAAGTRTRLRPQDWPVRRSFPAPSGSPDAATPGRRDSWPA